MRIIWKFIIPVTTAFILSSVQGKPINATDAQTCIELCSCCSGVATYDNDRCECNISENSDGNSDENVDCVSRMKEEAEERGLDLFRCDFSNVERTTRCTLGSKRTFGKNNIDQVAKYFMEDGPMTGSVFTAPLYKCKSSDCVGAPRVITQPDKAMENFRNDCPEKSVQVNENQSNDCVGVPQPSQQYVSSAVPQLVVNPPSQHIVINPMPQQIISSSIPQQILSNPPQQYVSNNDDVESPHIITQPKGTMPESETNNDNVSNSKSMNDCEPIAEQAAQSSEGRTPLNILEVQSITPTLLSILSQQCSQPLFKIPQAIKTISQTPCLSDLIGTSKCLLNFLRGRIKNNQKSFEKNFNQFMPKESENKITDTNADCENSPTIDALNPIANVPTFSYLVGPPAPAPMSNLHSMPAYSPAPIQYQIPNSMLNSFVPCNNYVPATFVIGSPYNVPFIPNYNTATQSMAIFSPISNVEENSIMMQKNSEQPNTYEYSFTTETSMLGSQKKICKKSYEEMSKKFTRDVKAMLNSDNEKKLQQKIEIGENQDKLTTTEIPKIDRTTTQKSATDKTIKMKIEKSKMENGGKVKSAKKSAVSKKPKEVNY